MNREQIWEERRARLEALQHQSKCDHEGFMEFRQRTLSNGVVHYGQQCTRCGQWKVGKRAEIAKETCGRPLPEYDNSLHAKFWEERADARQEILDWALDKEDEVDRAWRTKYEGYLQSPKWKAKRAAVLKRDNNLCQGCLRNRATEVHHLTYDHVFDELLFELVSVCGPCHDRLHPDRKSR